MPFPPDLIELDILTPYGTLFRYEDLPTDIEFDREMLFMLVRSLRDFVDNKLA